MKQVWPENCVLIFDNVGKNLLAIKEFKNNFYKKYNLEIICQKYNKVFPSNFLKKKKDSKLN